MTRERKPMNTNQPLSTDYETLQTASPTIRVAAVAMLLLTSNVVRAAETATITGITAPGGPFSVVALNTNGQVAGYFFDSDSLQRGFLWSNGTAVDLHTLGGTLSVVNCLNNAG